MNDAPPDTNMGLKLEEALKAAVKDAEARPVFYKDLLDAQVYVVGRTEAGHENEADGPHLQLKQWKQPDGSLAMPFFATMESFRDMFGFSEPHLLVPVIDLFRFAVQGTATLVMTSPEGSKEFKHDEMEMLVNLAAGDPLATALERAVKNTDESLHLGLWNDFYATLVGARLLVLGKPAGNGEKVTAPRLVKDGESLTVATWTHPKIDGPVVPFFSSQKILDLCVPAGESYISLPAADFLKMAVTFERPLVLNPGHEFYKIFAPQEVKDILAAANRNSRDQ